MMKKILFCIAILLLPVGAWAADVDVDVDNNGYVDVAYGGTNAATAANARTSLGVPATAATLAGDCTVGPCLDGTSDGGNYIKLWAGTGAYWTALQGGAPAANRSWRLPIDAPPSAGTTRLMNMDENGQMGFVDPATFQTADADLTTYAGLTPSANAQTILGHTFAQMRADLDIEPGVDYDAATPSTLNLTSDTSVTAAQLLVNKFISNQGATGEVDITLPAVSYSITRTVLIEETQIAEINPPSGESFDLSGTTLTADYCIDSPATVGSKAVFTRMQNASGTWVWSVDVVRGAWVDTGVSD